MPVVPPRPTRRPDTSGLYSAMSSLPPISLTELNAQAELMTRVDRKYFVPRELFVDLLERSAGQFRALQIGRTRVFRYRTIYFDTPQFEFFRQHAQGRRHRFKVRTRTYCESGDCRLEVKSKGYRDRTVKQRIAHDPTRSAALSLGDLDFIGRITGTDPTGLRPVLETLYRRATLCHDDQRVTCDIELQNTAGSLVHEGPSDVLVETKSSGSAGPLDLLLRSAGVRTHSVSKYCVAASLLYPELPHNKWNRTLSRYFGAEPRYQTAA
ncbi:polyphosphate polymerase domain-containing protein [Spelaeicoccus albus]|uniref:VTC domain-containing protein n=1 Tax=Spelaeicoccus albus TaxID=1280376 RepID=A0A7Z0D2I0_9MICO|nr:polyphosphate polymerase domain-containing protein [Spelaeicoccus albus]NYI67660.1 hypothetical protein [Spelaeicoccus albus]